MTHDELIRSLRPKVAGSWNLYKQLPKDMDFYVILSSLSGIIGNQGQANYDMGNVFQDALGRHAAGEGRRVYTLDLGVLVNVGFVAENMSSESILRRTGLDSVTEDDMLASLDILCDHRRPPPSVFHSQIMNGVALPEDVRRRGWVVPAWSMDPFFRHLHQLSSSDGSDNANAEDEVHYGTLLAAAESTAAAEVIVGSAIRKKLSKALALPEEDIDEAKPLHRYGVDSLVGVELATWFKKELQSEVGVVDILHSASIHELNYLVVARSQLVKHDQ